MVNVIIAVLVIWASAGYVIAVARGQASPRLASWAIWTLAMGIASIGALLTGQYGSAILAGTGSLTAAVVLLAGWRAGSRDVALLDKIGLAIGGTGVVFLAISLFIPAVPIAISVAVSVATDLAAFLPTFLNGARGMEPLSPYMKLATAAAIGVASAKSGPVAGQIFPLYELLACGLMCIIVLTRIEARRKLYIT
jgi:hypothetical protein